MAYSFEQVFAADPANPSNIAQNASITIFAPGDGTMTPIAITDPDGQPLANPIPVNANGFGSAFMADIDRVAWLGGGFTGFFTSYEGMKEVAVAAQTAAETAASTAGAEAAAAANAATASVVADAGAAAANAATAASDATAASASAATSALAAADAANLVNAPADVAIAAAINGTGATKAAITSAVNASVTAATVGLTYMPPAITPATATEIVMWGDSLAESGMDRITRVSTDDIVGLVAARAGLTFHNGGKWGQSSPQIAARQGGAPAYLTLTGNSIPASGAVTVTSTTTNPLGGSYDGSITGSIAGIPGTLAWVQATDTLTFTRTSSGAVTTVSAGARFVPDEALTRRGAIQIFEAGRNGAQDVTGNVSAIRGMGSYANARVLVLDVAPWSGQTSPDATNTAYREAVPEVFLPVFAWLRTTAAATAVGYTFTANDNTDIAAGLTPRGFRETGDDVHLNSLGRWAASKYILDALVARGWITSYHQPPTLTSTPTALFDLTSQPLGAISGKVPALVGTGDISQGTVANRPIVATDAVFKRKTMSFDATNDALSGNRPANPTVATVTFVARLQSIASGAAFAACFGVNIRDSGAGKFATFSTSGSATITTTTNTDTVAHVVSVVMNGATSSMWIDGVKTGTGTTTISNASFRIGVAQAMSAAAAVYHDTALSDAAVPVLHTELRAAYIV